MARCPAPWPWTARLRARREEMAAVSRPRVRLVVTADDFGYCPRRDQGIVEAFLAGTVTSVSLLVNGTAAESAAQLARRCLPGGGVCGGPGSRSPCPGVPRGNLRRP